MTIEVHHVGGRDGEVGEFPINPAFNADVNFHIYDADESCLPQVAAVCDSRGLRFQLHNYIVDQESGDSKIFINRCPCTSSLLPPANFKAEQYSPLWLLGDYRYADAFKTVETLRAPTASLDEICRRGGSNIDFLSVDTQGSEARVFRGAEEQMTRNIVGVLCEVEFHELYQNQPLFGDIHKLLRDNGFHFVRLFTREARVNFFRAGIGFRGDGMLMSADALFLKDIDIVEREYAAPNESLLKLAFIALAFGYVEYALDCLRRLKARNALVDPESAAGKPTYARFLSAVWRLFESAPFIPQPSFADLYTIAEARKRFEVNAPHPWETFNRNEARRKHFERLGDIDAFRHSLPGLVDPDDTEFEALLRRHGMETVANLVREKRLTHAAMTVQSLALLDEDGKVKIDAVLSEMGLLPAGANAVASQQDKPPPELAAESTRIAQRRGGVLQRLKRLFE